MSKATITILCPSGHRRKSQMTPNSNLLQVLEDMCHQESLDSADWGLIHQRKKCDLTMPWRLASIPTNALLEMYKLDERRPTSDVTVQLHLPDNSRHAGSFQPSVTLKEMLDWYRCQPDNIVSTFDKSINTENKVYPVCSYMSEEITGDYALSNTTLRELGLTSGAAVIRYNYRSMTDEDLTKINTRIDEKITRRRPPPPQQQQQQQQPTTEPPTRLQNSSATTEKTPIQPLPPTTVSSSSYPVIDTPVSSFNNQEFSIFRDVPVSRPANTTSQQQSKTLAEALGINVSFDHNPFSQQQQQHQQQQPQTDFSTFKFPEATKGQNLLQNDASDNRQNTRDSKTCDRHTMAYDLTKVPAPSTNKTEDLPDSFFELTPDDLRSVLNTLRQQGAEDNPLETRLMRERAQSARAVAYKHIVIRFVINSNCVLQGLFYPDEPVSNLLEFARTNLICSQLKQLDFYLYTSPPRVVLSDLKKQLSAYDLIPAAYVYLGHSKVSPLILELASNVRLGTIDEANQIVAQHVFNRTTSMNQDDISFTETNTNNRSNKRNVPATNLDDKQIRDKLSKFLPGKK
ncbi:unnamed protein product [Adineta steineri]|uniref:TUG ubiquitin-like domain-containing protein n=1 Tax=Adineta steineri TaxID=433720 RepID=A0A814ZBE6_9BILA|nr:unnamed protein product [Adineta steineri]CAF3810678.1 unnamed protein product [Adineta steineri]